MKIIPLKRLIYGFLAFGLILPLLSFNPNLNSAPYRIKTIVIDAGHGTDIPGASGKYSREDVIALKVTKLLGAAITESLPNIKVVYTRKWGTSVPLYERINIANRAKADIFISIHCNSLPVKAKNRATTRGVETLVAGYGRLGEQDVAIRENAAILLEKDYKSKYQGFDPKDPESVIIFSLMKNAFRDQSIKLASLIQTEYTKAGRVNRGVKEQPLAVLQRAGMPALLTEIGFITSPQEEKYMNSAAGQKEIVSCILKAIKTYKKQVEVK